MSGELPRCSVQYPSCGACGREIEWDETFYCDDCKLDYGDGDDQNVATYRDEEAESCASPCDNSWHKDNGIRDGWKHDCQPCSLPAGHSSDHWTPCTIKKVDA